MWQFYLGLFKQLSWNTTDQMAYKQQNFTAHSSGGWEVQDQEASTLTI